MNNRQDYRIKCLVSRDDNCHPVYWYSICASFVLLDLYHDCLDRQLNWNTIPIETIIS